MTTPVWEWPVTNVLQHLFLAIVMFPLAVAGMYWMLFRTFSVQQTVDYLLDWMRNPTKVCP